MRGSVKQIAWVARHVLWAYFFGNQSRTRLPKLLIIEALTQAASHTAIPTETRSQPQ